MMIEQELNLKLTIIQVQKSEKLRNILTINSLFK